MTWNGLIVTTQTPEEHMIPGTSYRGVAYGDGWPLQELSDITPNSVEYTMVQKIESLQEVRYEYGKTPPGVVDDVQFAYNYADSCRSRGIPVRLLLCATTSPYPAIDPEVAQKLSAQAQFLGYDYIGDLWGYSALYDDLYSESLLAELEQFVPLLNAFGLFDKISDLEQYIEVRWRILRQAGEKYVMHGDMLVRETPLEDYGSFWPCEVWEIPYPLDKS